MPSKSRKSRMVAALAVVVAASTLAGTAAQGGVISDMLARRRSQRQAQVQARTSGAAFHGQGVGGEIGPAGVAPSSFGEKFKKRFSIGKGRDRGDNGLTTKMQNGPATDRDASLFKSSR